MHARDIMTSPAITAGPTTSVLEIVKLMLDKHISAIPIVSGDGELVGIVSEGDLIRRSEIGSAEYSSWWLAAIGGKIGLAEEFVKTHGMRADEIMTREVVTVSDDMPIGRIAALLEKHRIKRVPVTADGKLTGVVSRANLLQALASQQERIQQAPSGNDRELRDTVLAALKHEPWSDLKHLNVVVTDGVVHYWGQVRSDEVRQALKVAAEGIAGVKSVVDHTHSSVTLY